MVTLKILFPSNYFDKRLVESEYSKEMEIAQSLGFDCVLFDYDDFLDSGKIGISPSGITSQDIMYRGWMLQIDDYDRLYEQLASKGYSLINSTWKYKLCHYFDDAYFHLENLIDTPKTIAVRIHNNELQWYNFEHLQWQELQLKNHFHDYFIMKDNVKSVKGTDFPTKIPVDISTNDLSSLIEKFKGLRGKLFTGDIILKQYENLKMYNGTTNEWRAFYFLKKLLTVSANSNQVSIAPRVTDEMLNAPAFNTLLSSFFTADFAETESGKWILIETGDGQVSGLSPNQNIMEFYSKIQNYWSGR